MGQVNDTCADLHYFLPYLRFTLSDGTQLYVALVIWSPPPIITHDSEKNYKSHASPKKSLPLTPLADASKVDLTVVVPAYNETERLPIMLDETIAHLTSPTRKHKRTFEILIVDDGSSDGTSATALKLGAKYPKCDIRVVTLEKNIGKGGAVRHGMLYGGGERLLMVDADGASRFEDLEPLWDAMDELAPNNGPAVVVGSRAHLVKSEAVVKVRSMSFYQARCPNIYILAAFPAPQHPHVWPAHHPSHCRCRPHPGHTVWFQTIFEVGCTADIPRPTPSDLDLRR